ncbi:unnamed protein product [Vicia faba]|uniref:Uncharacterized protein n=1 Tax=Vicia faba TaxID=3906 RepID=A0AAV0ZE50_VICFA|nr:unnamed protein product [Vicia faba]
MFCFETLYIFIMLQRSISENPLLLNYEIVSDMHMRNPLMLIKRLIHMCISESIPLINNMVSSDIHIRIQKILWGFLQRSLRRYKGILKNFLHKMTTPNPNFKMKGDGCQGYKWPPLCIFKKKQNLKSPILSLSFNIF